MVEAPKDVAAFERTNEYHGVYHVLHGLISPLTGVMPEQLKIRELLARLQSGTVREVIMATNPTVERCHSDVSRTAAQADADKSFPFGIWIASRRCGGICR